MEVGGGRRGRGVVTEVTGNADIVTWPVPFATAIVLRVQAAQLQTTSTAGD